MGPTAATTRRKRYANSSPTHTIAACALCPSLKCRDTAARCTSAIPNSPAARAHTRWSRADPTREETYKFLDKFMEEMAGLFPDEYFHIGGDEVAGKEWEVNPKIQAFMREHG